MWNLSLSCLTVANLLLRSPLLSPTREGFWSLRGLSVSRSFSPVLLSSSALGVQMDRCAFRQFLAAPVKMLGNEHEITGTFNQQFSAKKKNLTMVSCSFANCSDKVGGAVQVWKAKLTIRRSTFVRNRAEVAGAVYTRACLNLTLDNLLFLDNEAGYDGALMAEMEAKTNTTVSSVNLTRNSAKMWVGGMRIDCVGGTVRNCRFDSNSALVCGCFFDWAARSTPRNVWQCIFTNNTCVARGGAYTSCNIGQTLNFDECVFNRNVCERSANSISLENIEAVCTITRCTFSGKKDEEVSMKYPESVINFNACKFELEAREEENTHF